MTACSLMDALIDYNDAAWGYGDLSDARDYLTACLSEGSWTARSAAHYTVHDHATGMHLDVYPDHTELRGCGDDPYRPCSWMAGVDREAFAMFAAAVSLPDCIRA